jgi:hypothetical protein
MSRWGSFPRSVGDKLTDFPAGKDAGAHMAALRVYLALALVADFSTRVASVSWTALQEVTGLSRPMVKRGIATAETNGLIAIDTSNHRHSYRLLAQPDEVAFIQVPLFQLKASLPNLPTRGFHALDALKVYMTLLAVRSRNSDKAPISHTKIVLWSGVQPRRVRAAIDVLINHHLVHIVSAESKTTGYAYNEYQLLGFTNPQPVLPSSAPVGPPIVVTPNAAFLMVPKISEDVPF